jgi:hypothetical protein
LSALEWPARFPEDFAARAFAAYVDIDETVPREL